MSRRTAPRLALAAVGLAALAACVVNLSFDMNQPGLALKSASAGTIAQNIQIDLNSYPDVKTHQKDIQSLDLEALDATITEVKTATNQAHSLSLTLWLRKDVNDPPANDVKIGDLDNFLVLQNSTRRIAGNPAVDAFLLERFQNGGKFFLIVSGTTDGATDIVLDVNLHASMAYNTGLF
jgi:hypothetical protein